MIREQTLNDLNTFRPWKFCTLFYIPGYVPMCSSLQSMGTWVEFVSCCCVKIVQILIMLNWLIVLFRSPISFSVQFSQSCPTLCDPHELQHARPPSPSPTAGVHPNPRPLSWWCHPTISSSVVPFSSGPQSFPAPGSFPMSQLFASGGQSIRVSASISVLPMNTQDWSPLRWTGWISLQSKGLSRVFSNTTVQKHQFFGAQLSLQPNSHT